jgi:hypothetical protein
VAEERGQALTAWLDERKVDELLASMDDAQRAREIFEFIADRRRLTHAQLVEVVTALEAARAEAAALRNEREALQDHVNRLHERVLHAEAEAAALRDLEHGGGPVVRVLRRAVVTGRSIRRSAR